jgi:hypothetical protein
LAPGQVTESEQLVDRLSVELVEVNGKPSVIWIWWPQQPSRVPPRKLAETVARACRILANSAIALAARYGRKRWW